MVSPIIVNTNNFLNLCGCSVAVTVPSYFFGCCSSKKKGFMDVKDEEGVSNGAVIKKGKNCVQPLFFLYNDHG